MSMVFCRGCGKEIHETAISCPNCGAPQKIIAQKSNRDVSGVMTFFFGFLYFMVKGWFKAAIASLVICFFTGFLAWLIIPFLAKKFVDTFEGV